MTGELTNKSTDENTRPVASSAHTPGPWSIGHVRPQRVHPGLGPMWEAPVHVGDGETRGNCHTIVYGGGAGALTSTEAAVTANARLSIAAPVPVCATEATRAHAQIISEYWPRDRVIPYVWLWSMAF